MKAHVNNKLPEVNVDSVMVAFTFPKDPILRDRSVCLIGKKDVGYTVESINQYSGQAAIDIYKTLTGKDPYNGKENTQNG